MFLLVPILSMSHFYTSLFCPSLSCPVMFCVLSLNHHSPHTHTHTHTHTASRDRYVLKLFRDYMFHQALSDGAPVLDAGESSMSVSVSVSVSVCALWWQ